MFLRTGVPTSTLLVLVAAISTVRHTVAEETSTYAPLLPVSTLEPVVSTNTGSLPCWIILALMIVVCTYPTSVFASTTSLFASREKANLFTAHHTAGTWQGWLPFFCKGFDLKQLGVFLAEHAGHIASKVKSDEGGAAVLGPEYGAPKQSEPVRPGSEWRTRVEHSSIFAGVRGPFNPADPGVTPLEELAVHIQSQPTWPMQSPDHLFPISTIHLRHVDPSTTLLLLHA